MHIAQIDEPKFHVIMYFDKMLEDYRIVGIFTLETEAKLMLLDIKDKKELASRLELSLTAIKEFLVKERLGQLAETLQKITKEIEAA